MTDAFADWLAANDTRMAHHGYSAEDRERAAWDAAITAERERNAKVLDDATRAAADANDLRVYEVLRGIAAAIRSGS